MIGQIGALDPLLRVLERVEISGAQGAHRLGADQHPGILDDTEHLANAIVSVSHQMTHRRLVEPESELAGGGPFQTHLLLQIGGHHPVACSQRAVRADQVLGHREQREALGARHRSFGAGQHQVNDVLGSIVLATGDESLDAFDVPGAIALIDGLGGPGAHVRPGVRLGEDHGPRPTLVHPGLGQSLLLLGPLLEEDPGE
jgi:hypothetical protein